ncbi:MAG: hypothetical protein GY869_13730 [Planctomycetes bacterium]|nr:hypothetical protein [Planctomycetota bacterium]
MLRIIAIIGIGGAFAIAIAGYFVLKTQTEGTIDKFACLKKCRIKATLYVISFLSIFVLAVTGFWATIITGEPSTGYLLMLHCTAATGFCLATPLSLIISAEKNRFILGDFSPGLRCVGISKICYWIFVATAIPLILSMILSMFPLFGTLGQEFLYQIHRFCALLLVMAGLIYIGLNK